MAPKITPSQLRSKLRQIESKQKQAIDKYNHGVRKYNQKLRSAANSYNNEARKHNVRVRANRQLITNELNKLKSRSTVQHDVLRTSTIALNNSYQILAAREPDIERMAFGSDFLDLSEKEAANSLSVSNTLEDEEAEFSIDSEESLSRTSITNELSLISPDLDNRWRGALYSLSPKNPDASRHFCTSAREIFVHILDHYAPNAAVLSQYPECEKTNDGYPTRRSKVKHLLVNAGIISEEAVDFVNEDVGNVLQLFRVFNDGTHGSSGRFELSTLAAIKERVESGIAYLSAICERT